MSGTQVASGGERIHPEAAGFGVTSVTHIRSPLESRFFKVNPNSKDAIKWIMAPREFVKLQAFERWCKVFEPQLYGGFCSNLSIAWHCFTSKSCTVYLFQQHHCCRRTSLSVSSASILRASRLQPRRASINMACQCGPLCFVP